MLLENQSPCDVANSGYSYVDQPTALAAKCGMDTYFTDTVQGDYSLAQCAIVPNFKYFSSAGIVVGTQLYDPQTNNAIGSYWQGFYLYRGSLASPSDIVSWYLDPLNTTYVIPNDWVILEISSSGTIASLTQYNTLGPCNPRPDMGPLRLAGGYFNNVQGYSLSSATDITSGICGMKNSITAWFNSSLPVCGGSAPPLPNCKNKGWRSSYVYWSSSQSADLQVGVTIYTYSSSNDIYTPFANKVRLYKINTGGSVPYNQGIWDDLSTFGAEWYFIETDSSGTITTMTQVNTIQNPTCP